MKPRNGAVVALLLLTSCNWEPQPETASVQVPARLLVGKIPESEVAVLKAVEATNFPGPRRYQAMAYYPPTGKTQLFGGRDSTSSQTLNDLWAWDGRDWSQVTADVRPPGRYESALAYDPARKSLILYGGRGASVLADTWDWTPSKGWTELKPTANPGPMYGHHMVTDTSRNKILLLTQYSATILQSEVWEWDGAALTWTRRTPVASSNAPSLGSVSPLPSYDEGRQKLFAVVSANQFWEWDPVSTGWALRRDSQEPVGFGSGGPIAYDTFRRRHVILSDLPQIWEVDTKEPTYYMRVMSSAPYAEHEVPLVFDSGRNVMVYGPWQVNSNVMWEYQVSNLGNGEGCKDAAACESGNCVEGVCCDVTACTGACRSCNVPGSEGACVAAKAGAEIPGSCTDGLACDSSGACKTRNGQVCTAAGDCASGFCADGVCCDSACTGACVACNLTGQAGACRPHPSGTDPKGECGKGIGVCKSTCDGAGSCVYPRAVMTCGTCMTCDGFGTCTLFDQSCKSSSGTGDVSCYVDGVNGDDSRSGLSEAEAVKSQSKLGSTCTTVRFKRGSVFGEKLRIMDKVKTYTNYGDAKEALPKFVIPRSKSSGPVIHAIGTMGVTFDGLYLSGATGDGTVEGQLQGACVALGYADRLTNSELVDCDIGVILYDKGNTVQGNYFHDLITGVDASPAVDSYLAGGAVGVMVRASNSTIQWNIFVNCQGPAKSAGGPGVCHGGATEITVPRGGSIDRVIVNYNYSYGNCGFTAIGSSFGDAGRGAYSSLSYNYNISVNSGWMALLEVANSDLKGVSFANNTFAAHKGSTNNGILAVIYAAGSSGTSTGELKPDSVSLDCNLFVVDGVPSLDTLLHKSFTQQNNLVFDMSKQDPGLVNVKGTTAAAYDLTAGSPAVNACRTYDITPEHLAMSDFFGRQAPDSTSMRVDVGACEYGTPQIKPPQFFPGAAGWIGSSTGAGGTGGQGGAGTSGTATGLGGASTAVPRTGGAGGTTRSGAGGVTGVGGSQGGYDGGIPGDGGGKADASTATGGSKGDRDAARDATSPHSTRSGCSCELGQRPVSIPGTTLLVLLGGLLAQKAKRARDRRRTWSRGLGQRRPRRLS